MNVLLLFHCIYETETIIIAQTDDLCLLVDRVLKSNTYDTLLNAYSGNTYVNKMQY